MMTIRCIFPLVLAVTLVMCSPMHVDAWTLGLPPKVALSDERDVTKKSRLAAFRTTTSLLNPENSRIDVAINKHDVKEKVAEENIPFLAAAFKGHLQFFGFFLSATALAHLPFVAAAIGKLLFFISMKAATPIQPLSITCWLCHYPLMLAAPELTLSTFRAGKKKNSPLMNNLGWLFAMNNIQAFFILMSHAVIQHNPILELKLFNFAGWILRSTIFSTPFLCLAPKRGWLATPVVAWLTLLNIISFENWYGRVLSMAAMASVVCSKQSGNQVFKAGYVMTALMPILVPSSITDVGHSIGASILNIAVMIMLLGLKVESHGHVFRRLIPKRFQVFSPHLKVKFEK